MTSTRSTRAVVIILACGVAVFFALVALGIWQVYRLNWKLELVERVEQRVDAPVVPMPGSKAWNRLQPDEVEYRHVKATGTLMPELSVRTTATTLYGSGYWLLTPLRLGNGDTVLINRGFVSSGFDIGADTARLSNTAEPVTFRGLLRLSEPEGGFLRANRPKENRWYSRDAKAMTDAWGLRQVAPFFIDAEAGTAGVSGQRADPARKPIPGLSVVHFRNNHLVYAVTWFVLALMVAGGLGFLLRDRFKRQS